MPTRRTFVASAASVAVAGCVLQDDGPSPPTTTPTDDAATPTESPTDTTPTGGETTVTYVLRSGPIPNAFASATATVRPVAVGDERDLGPCYPEVYEGPYKPTITPIATPRGACHRGDALAVDLTTIDETTIDLSAPASAEGHALVATEIVGTDRDGEPITAIKGTGGVILLEAPSAPSGAYGVELGIENGPEEADYDYWVTTDRFDPEG